MSINSLENSGFSDINEKNNLIPGPDSTTRLLAIDTKDKCALSTVIPMRLNLVMGTLERIMRLLFSINVEL